jgi:hypothetical protein
MRLIAATVLLIMGNPIVAHLRVVENCGRWQYAPVVRLLIARRVLRIALLSHRATHVHFNSESHTDRKPKVKGLSNTLRPFQLFDDLA